MTYVLKGSGNVSMLAGAARALVADLDADLPLRSVETMEAAVVASTASYRLAAALLAGLSALALALSLTGIHGALSYLVARRTREIGIRVSLGAGRGDVLRMTLGRGVLLAALSQGVGLPLALAGSRLARSALYEVGTLDPATLLPVVVVVLGTALLASYLPARRALRVDPASTLRED